LSFGKLVANQFSSCKVFIPICVVGISCFINVIYVYLRVLVLFNGNATSGAGTAYPPPTPEIFPGF
jgi:hypothetical protein